MSRSKRKIYLATSLFTQAEQSYGFQVTGQLEEISFEVYYPWRDAGDSEFANAPIHHTTSINRKIFRNNLTALQSADIIVAIIEGADVDSGVAFEIGHAFSSGKPIIGLRTDFREQGLRIGATNVMLAEACLAIFNTPEKLCRFLEHNQLDNLPSAVGFEQFYERVCEEYGDPVKHSFTNEMQAICSSTIKEIIGDDRLGRVLDIGSGKGAFLGGINASQKVAMDASPKMLAASQKENPDALCLHGNFLNNGFSSDSFDLLNAAYVIDHIDNISHFLSECHRIVKPGGKVIITSLDSDFHESFREDPNLLKYQVEGESIQTLSDLDAATEVDAIAYNLFSQRKVMTRKTRSGVKIKFWILGKA